MRKNLEKEDISWDPETENFISVNGTAQVNKYCKIETHTPSTKLILKGPFYPFHYLSKDCSDLMLHTKWNSIDKYSYSSHVTYTGTFSILVILLTGKGKYLYLSFGGQMGVGVGRPLPK